MHDVSRGNRIYLNSTEFYILKKLSIGLRYVQMQSTLEAASSFF